MNPLYFIDPLGLSPFNGFGSGFNNYMQSAGSLGLSMEKQGATPEEISVAFGRMAEGDLPKQARQFMEGWIYGSASYSFVAAVACFSASLAISGVLALAQLLALGQERCWDSCKWYHYDRSWGSCNSCRHKSN